MAYHSQMQENDGNEVDPYLVKLHKNVEKYVRWLNWVTLTLILLELSTMIYVTVYAVNTCTSNLKVAEIITGAVFTVLSILFGVFGFLILGRLKKYFREFYDENMNMILFATLGLSLSLLSRGLVDSIRYFSHDFSALLNQNETLFNTVLLIGCDLIPIFF